MRKSISILILALVAVAATAQPRLWTPEYYLGVHGGVSASTVIFQPRAEYMTPITNACVLGGNGGLAFRYAGQIGRASCRERVSFAV